MKLHTTDWGVSRSVLLSSQPASARINYDEIREVFGKLCRQNTCGRLNNVVSRVNSILTIQNAITLFRPKFDSKSNRRACTVLGGQTVQEVRIPSRLSKVAQKGEKCFPGTVYNEFLEVTYQVGHREESMGTRRPWSSIAIKPLQFLSRFLN